MPYRHYLPSHQPGLHPVMIYMCTSPPSCLKNASRILLPLIYECLTHGILLNSFLLTVHHHAAHTSLSATTLHLPLLTTVLLPPFQKNIFKKIPENIPKKRPVLNCCFPAGKSLQQFTFSNAHRWMTNLES